MSVLILSPNGVSVLKPSLSVAVASDDTSGKTIIVTSPQMLNDNLTIPKDIALKIVHGGVITINEGKTLTINGPLDTGKYRIFNGRIAYKGQVMPHWWGAMADGQGLTPTDTGEDISSASWNSWENTPFKTNSAWSPYYVGGVFNPPTVKPFQNTDTWDYIGCNMALWSGSNSAYFPTGTYVINVGNSARTFPGLITMRGQEQTVSGDGTFQTIITTKETAEFFSTNNKGTQNKYKLFTLWRPGGPQTVIRDIQFSGPNGYGQDNYNLALIWGGNTNGVTLRDLWLTSADMGIWNEDHSGDMFVKGTTIEYIFSNAIYTDATSELSVDFCNIWDSAGTPAQTGVKALGSTRVSSTKFIGLRNGAILADSAVISGNTFYVTNGTANYISVAHNSTITGNTMTVSSAGSVLHVGHDTAVTGNYFINANTHSILDLGDGTASSANNITVTGNVFVKTDATAEAQNYAILAVQNSVGYTQAATLSTIIVGNTFTGRAMPSIGAATMSKNTFDNVLGMDTNIYITATTTQLVDKTNDINTINKFISRAVWNSITNKFVYATGTANTSVWNDAVGALAHTPV